MSESSSKENWPGADIARNTSRLTLLFARTASAPLKISPVVDAGQLSMPTPRSVLLAVLSLNRFYGVRVYRDGLRFVNPVHAGGNAVGT